MNIKYQLDKSTNESSEFKNWIDKLTMEAGAQESIREGARREQ